MPAPTTYQVLKARGSTSGSWYRVSQAVAGSDCPLGDWGSGQATNAFRGKQLLAPIAVG